MRDSRLMVRVAVIKLRTEPVPNNSDCAILCGES